MTYIILDKDNNERAGGLQFTFDTREQAQRSIDNLKKYGDPYGPYRIVEGVSSKKGIIR